MPTLQLNQEQREIVELLCSDLAEAMSADTGPLHDSGDSRREILKEFEAHCDHLSKAMELAGLEGLNQYCEQLALQFSSLIDDNNSFDEDFVDHLTSWPMVLLGYLHLLIENEIKNENHEESDDESWPACIEDLINYLGNPIWPQVCDVKQLASLRNALSHADIVIQETASLPLVIDDESSSLDVSGDVRRELLEGLLIELPEQSRAFESSVNLYLQSRSIEQLAPAQRVAHTIKGSANIVGIKGLANLMHLSEDLLIGLSKGKIQDNDFNDLLLDTADCLGDVTDFLTGLAPKPDAITSVLNALVACFDTAESVENGISTKDTDESDGAIEFEGLEELGDLETTIAEDDPQMFVSEIFGSEAIDAIQEPADLEEKPTVSAGSASATDLTETEKNEDDDNVGHMLSLPQQHAQQLLRIAGESTIANTQVMAQLDAMKTSIEQTDRYHKRIKAMAMELEALLQTQNALRSAMYRSRSGEHNINESGSTEESTDFDPLEMESYSELHSFSSQLLELTADSYEAVTHIEDQIEDLTTIAFSQRQLNRDNNDLLLKTHMVAVDSVVPRLQRCVRQACRLTQKSVNLEIIGETLQIDNRVLSRVIDPLMHLLRNAVDHGIEDDEERLAANKDSTGSIIVEFIQRGELITIECRDDGRGLNVDLIRQKALEKGLIEEQDTLDENALGRLLFLPGFSTRDLVSQTSGRGIGLDVVQEEVKRLKGSVQLSNSEACGCCFSLLLPASILTAHALLVRVSAEHQSCILSILSRGVHNVVYVDNSQLQRSGEGLSFHYEDQDIPVFSLHDLTAVPQSDNNKINALLIIRRDDLSLVAVSVDNIIASQDLVIKPLNAFTYHPPGVVGATILGDGTVSSVVDIQELPGLSMNHEQYARLQAQREAIALQNRAEEWQLPLALIIDDSLSARQSLSQFIGELGMQVKTAKDGFEAISVMKEAKPNVILVDLEMPRMNGLEFTAHLRADETTKDIPVIMITSRSTEKHRQLADKAGVDDYLNKPWSDEDLFTSIQQQLEKRESVASH